ncbi:MAG: ABC transporter substrate-binding protein [Thermoanaerobaculia bacterium]|jgi:ABC-type transport system substrate-binding protein
MIGAKLGDRYEIISELGHGGMGVVYRAHDPLLNRDVAVKIIPPSLLTPQAEERFRREAQLVAQMDHPGIVPIYDIGNADGALFFVMPVVRGESLRSYLRKKLKSLRDLLEVGIRVAEALEYAHSHGVVHRDVKPENVMIYEEDGQLRVRVMDFGLARTSKTGRITQTGALVGTAHYFSPEQLAGNDIDSRTDIYALGTVLYECVSGQPPFTGDMQAVLYRIAHEIPPSLRAQGALIPEELEDIVMRALAKDPAKRFQRAADLAVALEHFRSRIGSEQQDKAFQISRAVTAQYARPPVSRFVGREKELVDIQRRLHAALEGECQFVVVGGEPGIGKSRLLEEIETLARARRIRVLHGRFMEQDRTFPYQAFVELLQEYFRGGETHSSAEQPDFSDLAHELVAIFPALGEVTALRSGSKGTASADGTKIDDRTYVYELIARTLTRIAAGRPLVLVLENLHAAETSVDALAYVVRRLGPTPTLVTSTYRTTEVDRRHPLMRMIEGFSNDSRFAHIVLEPLSTEDHRLLVQSMIGQEPVADSLAQRLYESTEANPFFTKELVRSLLDSGGIAKSDTGEWHLSRQVTIAADALPETIQQTVERRVERLAEQLRDLLSIASVLGKTFQSRDLEALAEGKEIEDDIDLLIHEGLLEEAKESRGGDMLTFSSGIVRDVLYGTLSRRRRKALHRKYAELLEARNAGRLERVYPQLVHHFSEGDVAEKTVEYGLELARRSLDAYTPERAVRVIRTVMEFLDDDSGSGAANEGESRTILASAHRMLGNLEAALREADQAVRVFELAAPRRAPKAMLLAAEIAWHARLAEETRHWLARGIFAARSFDQPAVLHDLLSLALTLASLRGEHDEAKRIHEEIEALEARAHPAVLEAEASIPSGGTLTVGLVNPIVAAVPSEMTIDEEGEVLALVYQTLFESDGQGHQVPLLCSDWAVEEGGRQIRIVLRDDVVFQDGTPLTAEIVKASFERGIRTERRDPSAALAGIVGASDYRHGSADSVAGIVVRSDREIEFRLAEALPFYPALLSDRTIGIAKVDTEGRPIGSGPFRIAKQGRDAVVLEAVDAAPHRPRPKVDSLVFRVLSSAADMASELRAGRIDVARDLVPQDLEEILRDPRLRDGHVEAPKKNIFLAVFNRFSPVGSNDKLREALFRSVPTSDLVWRTLGRLAQPATGIIPPGIFGHDPGIKRKVLSRDHALELIAASGLPTPIRVVAAAHPIFHDRYRSLMSALLELWRDLGVELSFTATTMAAFLESARDAAGIDMRIGRWVADYDDPDTFTHGLFNSTNGLFARYYSSPDLDTVLEGARRETRPVVREALYHRFESLIAKESAVLPLFHEIDYRVVSPRVRGLVLSSHSPYVNYDKLGVTEEVRAAAVGAAVGGGVIHVPIAEDVNEFDPVHSHTVERAEISGTIFETLTRCVEGARVVPWLASEIRAEEGGTRYRIRVREARFHDGRRLTARDVRHSWERLLLDDKGDSQWLLAPVRGAVALIEGRSRDLSGFKIVTPYEFVVELERPLAFFAPMLSHPSLAIVPEGTERLGTSWRGGCVGTGPFRLVKFEKGKRIEVEKNPIYWNRGFPKSEGMVFHLGLSPSQIREEFVAGRLSIASELFPHDVERLRHDPLFAAGYREVPRLSIYFAALNTKRGPLADRDVRRALVQSVSVPSIVQRTLGRLAIPAHGMISPGLLGYSPDLPRVADVAMPEEKLGMELELNVHPMYAGHYSMISSEIFSAFRARGVRIRTVDRPMAEFLEVQTRGDADINMSRWVADYPDTDTFMHGLLHSQGGIIGRFCGCPEIDLLIDRARTELDLSLRHSIYREIEELIARDARVLPLFHEQIYRFVRPEIEGLAFSGSLPEVMYESLRVRR